MSNSDKDSDIQGYCDFCGRRITEDDSSYGDMKGHIFCKMSCLESFGKRNNYTCGYCNNHMCNYFSFQNFLNKTFYKIYVLSYHHKSYHLQLFFSHKNRNNPEYRSLCQN